EAVHGNLLVDFSEAESSGLPVSTWRKGQAATPQHSDEFNWLQEMTSAPDFSTKAAAPQSSVGLAQRKREMQVEAEMRREGAW
ncbi:unnamed protein product, partial [Durusdinium trenchii]